MPNKQYQKGRRKEYKICDKMKSFCEIVQRTAGSHSPIDVFAISKELKTIFFIQSKPNNFPKSSEKKIMDDWGWLNDEFIVKFYVE